MTNNLAVISSDIQTKTAVSKSGLAKSPKSPRGPGAFGDMPYEQARALGYIRALEEFPAVAEGTVGTKYRFRAECKRDADMFLSAISTFIEPNWTLTPPTSYPAVEGSFTLAGEISPRNLLWVACAIVDCHVLAQTLDQEKSYNPQRDYFRRIDTHNPEFVPSTEVLVEIKNGMARYVKSLKYLLEDAKEFMASLKNISGR